MIFLQEAHARYHRNLPLVMYRVGQNHIYTVYIRYFWLGNHQIYGVFIRIYTVLANPSHVLLQHASLATEVPPPLTLHI